MAKMIAELADRIALVPFDPEHAPLVANWVQTEEELLWLAPSTVGPLTPNTVVGWAKPNGNAFLFFDENEAQPVAYGELNPMRREPDHFWLGHIIVSPPHRRRGVGRRFVGALLDYVFDQLCAARVSLIVFPKNQAAIQCYCRAGFKIVAEEFHRFGPDKKKHRFLRLEAESSHH